MIFKPLHPSKATSFLFGTRTIFLRKTLTCRMFVSSPPLYILVIWRARTLAVSCADRCFETQDFHFSEPQNAIFKGLEPQNCAFSGNLRNPTKSKFGWVIWTAQTVKKNLIKSVLRCTQIKCHESGMSPSNSKKSHLDVQSLDLGILMSVGGLLFSVSLVLNLVSCP